MHAGRRDDDGGQMQGGGSAGGRTSLHSSPRSRPPQRPYPSGWAPGPPSGRGRPPASGRWRRKSLPAKIGYIAATLSAVIAVVAGIGFFTVYHQLTGNITKVAVGHLSGQTVYGPLNILVLGSQTRLGQRGNFGFTADPAVSNSDNLLLVHLDATHTHAIVLSIPRDTFVYQPACQERSYVGTGVWPAQPYPPGAIIDGALNIGGPTCAVQTVEALTGIQLDHFVEFNFNSFRTMVGKLGGVQVCVPPGPGYHDQQANLNLSPGLHWVNYGQALAYVRARHSLGGPDAGGDLPRIELQQAFISSVVQQVNQQGVLKDFPKLLSIAYTATHALTVDQGLSSIDSILRLAESLAHLKSQNVSLITMPTAANTYPGLSQHLMPVQPQDDVLFQMIRTGQPWTGALPVQPYSSVQVNVVNATGQPGLATRTAQQLRQLGFNAQPVPGGAAYSSTTTVQYAGTTQADSAYTLMTALNSFPAGQNTLPEEQSQVGSPGAVTLVVGSNFTGVQAPKATQPAPSATTSKGKSGSSAGSPGTGASPSPSSGAAAVQSRNAGANICSGLPPSYSPG
jgi:LCP family protein required for cell wall assembly